MAYPNRLAEHSYEGHIDGIHVEWADNAKTRLDEKAKDLRGNPTTAKAATEHLAHSCAKRLGKDRIRILGTFHNTTTFLGQTRPDDYHVSIVVKPGQWKVHIYVDGLADGPTAFDNLTIKGESIMKPKITVRDPTLSIGDLPPL
ncbi:hypothetical protein FQN50_008881 [Emmonsiellopsis sp. PD_5]|nr:hypothetical protein FQN50_008881 [Emmonsiellopsis sp. PD_5]